MKHLSLFAILLLSFLSSCSPRQESPTQSLWQLGFSCSDPEFTQVIQNSIQDLRPECTTPLPPSLTSVHLAADYAFPDSLALLRLADSLLMKANAAPQSLIEPLYALIALRQDYFHYGNIAHSLSLKERIINQLAYYTSLQKPEGFIRSEDGTIPTYLQILLCENFSIASQFASLWGDEKLSRLYELKSAYIRDAIKKGCWDDDHHAFLAGFDTQMKRDSSFTTINQFWAVYTGLFPAVHLPQLFVDHQPPLLNEIAVPSVLEAMAYVRAGYTQQYCELYKQYKPTGIDLSAAIVPIVLYGIFGLSPSKSPEGDYILTPQLDSLEWLKGCIPVKEGLIRFHFAANGKYQIDLPPHTSLLLNWHGKTKKIKG